MGKGLADKLQKAGDIATNISTNGLLIAGGLKGVEYLDKMDYSAPTQSLATALAAGSLIYLNKSGIIKGLSKGVNNAFRKTKDKAMVGIRNLALAGYIGAATLANIGNAQEISKISQRYFKKKKQFWIKILKKNILIMMMKYL